MSAQLVGLEGFPPDNPLFTGVAPKMWDPARYGTLVHPGDSYSYDIFSQAGQALPTPGAVDPLGGLDARPASSRRASRSPPPGS